MGARLPSFARWWRRTGPYPAALFAPPAGKLLPNSSWWDAATWDGPFAATQASREVQAEYFAGRWGDMPTLPRAVAAAYSPRITITFDLEYYRYVRNVWMVRPGPGCGKEARASLAPAGRRDAQRQAPLWAAELECMVVRPGDSRGDGRGDSRRTGSGADRHPFLCPL